MARGEVEIRRTYRFCASHRLARAEWGDERNLEVYGPASYPRGHGHNYRLTVVVAGLPDATDRVVDLALLDRVVEEEVVLPFDHKNLNADVPALAGRVPTTEVLLQEIWDRLERRLPRGLLRRVVLRQDEFLEGSIGGG